MRNTATGEVIRTEEEEDRGGGIGHSSSLMFGNTLLYDILQESPGPGKEGDELHQ